MVQSADAPVMSSGPAPVKRASGSIRIGFWLSWQELNGRRSVFVINVILIALLVSFAVTIDLMGRAKENTVDDRIDYIGPSLSLVPEGMTSSDLFTANLKGRVFSHDVFRFLRNDFSSLLRGSEERLILRLPAGTGTVPVIGMDFRKAHSYPFFRYSLKRGEIITGSLYARKHGIRRSDPLKVGGRKFQVVDVLATAGGIDDLSVFIPLDELQELTGNNGLINEIRLFPTTASSLDTLYKELSMHYPRLAVIDTNRGAVAESEIDSTLHAYQKGIYGAAFLLMALCIMISTYMNLEGRKAEMSTLFTLGVSRRLIFLVLNLRTLWIILAGFILGYVAALIVTVTQGRNISIASVWSWTSFCIVASGAVLLGVLVTMPFALHSVYRRELTGYL